MLKTVRTMITSLPLVVWPAMAADAGTTTGITSIGPALFLFTIAGALLLTLIFRSIANHVVKWQDRPGANSVGARQAQP